MVGKGDRRSDALSPIVEIRDLSFGYRRGQRVLNGVNLLIDEPGLYCVLGPNGAGKSTLARCLCGLVKRLSGTVLIRGREVSGYRLKELSRIIAYVPVSATSTFAMTVMDVVLLGRSNRGRFRVSDEDMAAARRALKVFGLEEIAMRKSTELSAGQSQSVNLARGLVQGTEIIVLDEPTANLDVRHQVFVAELFSALARRAGMTVIMISHDLNIAARYSDRIFLMSDAGRIVATGAPDEVMVPDTIRFVYGVESSVLFDCGHPLISIESALSQDEIAAWRTSYDLKQGV